MENVKCKERNLLGKQFGTTRKIYADTFIMSTTTETYFFVNNAGNKVFDNAIEVLHKTIDIIASPYQQASAEIDSARIRTA